MFIKKFGVVALIALGAGFFITGCSSSEPKQEEAPVAAQEEEVVVEDEYEEGPMDDFSFIMPSALQITSIFQRQGVGFNPTLVNEKSNINNYVSKLSKLMNLGVYTSDLCYNVLNDQSQQSIEFLKVVKQLSEDVGMGSIFSSGPLFERFESNIGNRDSIIFIMADLQEETDLYIKRSEQEHLAMVIFAGAWTEGMYIGINGTGDEGINEEFIPRLMEQMTLLENLIKGLKAQPNMNDNLKGFIATYEDLNAYFGAMEGVDLDNFEFDLEKITKDHINEINSKITAIRTSIIS